MNLISHPTLRAALLATVFFLPGSANAFAGTAEFRPPAVPLVAADPYFSIWSPADKLTDADTVHWTRKPQRLTSTVLIDGRAYRVMGTQPDFFPALPQTGLNVTPTRSIYTFAGAGVALTVTFMSPVLPDDLDLLSRPVTYVTFAVRSTDGKEHSVGAQFLVNPEIAVNEPQQPVRTTYEMIDGLGVAVAGSVEQPVLRKKGDNLRIDWGQLYLAAPEEQVLVSPHAYEFTSHVSLGDPASWSTNKIYIVPQHSPSAEGGQPAMSAAAAPPLGVSFDFRKVGSQPVTRWLMLAYDDEFSIQYFKKNLRPYWRRNGDDARALLKKAAADYTALVKRCAQFDAEFMADMTQVGGEKFAQLCALAYRQIVAGCKLVADANGQPLLFPKENTSNGCIGTVDVIYPLAPFCLLFSPSLTKAMLVPPLAYAGSPRWKFPFAPHDLGTYPLANGQVYGGGERTADHQMPVEESANLIILVTALAEREGNADFAAPYWPVLMQWADYLKEKGVDPELQLCTDDFAGHLAHNVNLSAKAIVALGAFGKLCERRGEPDKAKGFTALAKQFAARWVKEASDGDHFRLAFDQPGSWSQKYNLIWDQVLGLKLFPPAVLKKEMNSYPAVMHRYGLALDNRKPYAELPWSFWTASLTGNDGDFKRLVDPIYDYVNTTPSRVPFADFYWTQTAKEAGMHARPVLGGIFIKPLLAPKLWRKWSGRDTTKAANWAPLPTPPRITVVVPTAETQPALWRYTAQTPPADWLQPDFNDAAWSQGKSGFGTAHTPGAVIGTDWHTADIWLRREITLPAAEHSQLQFSVYHDEDVEIYVNGIPAAKENGFAADYVSLPIAPAAKAIMKPGAKLLIAVHCHQTIGGQGIDVGLEDVQ